MLATVLRTPSQMHAAQPCSTVIENTPTQQTPLLLEHIGRLARMSVLDTEVDGSNPGSSMLCP